MIGSERLPLQKQFGFPRQRRQKICCWRKFDEGIYCGVAYISPATAPENILDACNVTRQLGTPRGRYDECSSKFSLSMKPRFIEPVGKRGCFEGVGEGV